jgi:hypothetical protein
MHVVATAAGEAMAAGYQGMADDAVADFDALDAGPHCFNPAGILMAHDIGQLDIDLAAPDSFDHMQVGAADPGSADAHDHIGGPCDLRVGYVLVPDKFLGCQLFIKCVEYCSLH